MHSCVSLEKAEIVGKSKFLLKWNQVPVKLVPRDQVESVQALPGRLFHGKLMNAKRYEYQLGTLVRSLNQGGSPRP